MSPEPHPVHDQRRLVAIMFTDVVSYSARVQRDEPGTLALVKADFVRITGLVAQNGGEVIETMGDGMLLCFPSAVQAVACALQIQAEFNMRRAQKSAGDDLEHRIGIHVGDVVRTGGKVVGDGTNIAARLQTLAPSGGICVSQMVRDTIKGKLAFQEESLGPQRLKNIAEKMTVYSLMPPGGPAPAARARTKRAGFIAAVILLALISFVWWKQSRPSVATGKEAAPPTPVVAAVPDSKSLAVLPFTNMSEDKGNAFFADGVQEDILTGLALIGDMQVISRTSVMGYRDTTKPIQQIGRELGVAFILEGSVRRIGNKVRVTGQLINVRTGLHLWAKAYDRELDDIFAIQAALAKDIAAELHAVLTPQDVARLEARPTDNIEAYQLYLQARASWGSGEGTPEMLAHMQPLLERAVQLDPKFALAWLELSNVHWRAFDYLDHNEARFARAKVALDTAAQLSPDALEVIMALAGYLQAGGDQAGAAAQKQRLVRLYPNHPSTLMMLARDSHDPREKLDYFQRARRLDPRNPELLDNLSGYFLGGRHYEEALALADEANALSPSNTLRSAHVAMIPFLARGATGPMEAFLAQIPPEARRTDPNAIMALANWAYTTGDAAGLIRLWEESGAHWRFAPETGRLDTIVVAQALIVQGQRDRARPLLEKNRDELAAALATDSGNYRKWADLALIQTMLGNGPEAKTAEDQARQLASWMSFAMLHAWGGDKAAALAELARRIPDGGNYHETNVHELRRQIGLWPLWGDSRFETILGDPKNNAPLF